MRPTIALMLLLLMLNACTAPVAAPTNTPQAPTQPPTATLAPSSTIAPTETPAPPLLTVITQTIQESGQSPTYTLTANIPQVVGAEAFNALAATLVDDDITLFKEGVLTMPPVPDGYGSFLDISFNVTSAEPQAFSVLVGISGYADGAAHPYHYARVLNYDLVLDHSLALADLFTPASDYLGRIAEYCLSELQTREFVDNLAGGGSYRSQLCGVEHHPRWIAHHL